MGGVAAALLADMLGGLLLIASGPGAIWRVLWVFWAESAAAGIVAAVSMQQGTASLSDDAWLAMAAQTLDAQARRGPSAGQTLYQFQLELEQRRQRLAWLAALDRRTAEGAAAFALARATETGFTSGLFGCVFVGFSLAHAVFLLLLGLFAAVVSAIGSPIDVWVHAGAGPVSLVAAPETSGVPDFGGVLVVMALVFIAGLVPLRRPIRFAESQAATREAMTRLFILQFVLIIGSIPAILLGSVPLAVVFIGVKTVADVYPLWCQRRATRS